MDQICRNREIAVAEFFFYATVLMAAATALWIWLRRYHFPWWLLTIIEFGILIQFAGGLMHFGGAQLYDHVFFYIRFGCNGKKCVLKEHKYYIKSSI